MSRLREDSEADSHSKDAQCEQLTSELHRREEENANAQQVWMRRVAQLERTLTLEGEHIKTILRQRDQLAVRKAGLDARVESLDTQVRRDNSHTPSNMISYTTNTPLYTWYQIDKQTLFSFLSFFLTFNLLS